MARPAHYATAREYSAAWRDKMVEIWRDRMDLLGIHRTGALRSSLAPGAFSMDDAGGVIAFRFLLYGIYVDAGTGRGYLRGNGGRLDILDPAYRHAHGMRGPARERRRWFTVSWAISRRVLADRLAADIGDRFAGMFDDLSP